LYADGFKNIKLCSSKGIIGKDNTYGNPEYENLAKFTNKENLKGTLTDAMRGADVFVGVSAPGIVTGEMVKSMNKDAVIFAMANPVPEIMPEIALESGAKVVGTGRSDYKNQINNVLAFPGIFRGALDVRASDINEDMKKAAAYALAGLIKDEELSPDYIIPGPFDKRVAIVIAEAVKEAAAKSGVARIKG
jgi:malate dehydrogenase (oxaloacetate-decarboxylating)